MMANNPAKTRLLKGRTADQVRSRVVGIAKGIRATNTELQSAVTRHMGKHISGQEATLKAARSTFNKAIMRGGKYAGKKLLTGAAIAGPVGLAVSLAPDVARAAQSAQKQHIAKRERQQVSEINKMKGRAAKARLQRRARGGK